MVLIIHLDCGNAFFFFSNLSGSSSVSLTPQRRTKAALKDYGWSDYLGDITGDILNEPYQLVKKNLSFFLRHLKCRVITLVHRGPPAGWGPFLTCDFWKLPKHTVPLLRGSCLETFEVIEAVPAPPSAGRRWNPSGFGAWGARRRGDSHLQSPFAWVNSLQRLTQGPRCLFIWTFKGCYITRLNELFNGKDCSELFCLTSWFIQEVRS